MRNFIISILGGITLDELNNVKNLYKSALELKRQEYFRVGDLVYNNKDYSNSFTPLYITSIYRGLQGDICFTLSNDNRGSSRSGDLKVLAKFVTYNKPECCDHCKQKVL